MDPPVDGGWVDVGLKLMPQADSAPARRSRLQPTGIADTAPSRDLKGGGRHFSICSFFFFFLGVMVVNFTFTSHPWQEEIFAKFCPPCDLTDSNFPGDPVT